jgi:biotin carboxyl carrier protein
MKRTLLVEIDGEEVSITVERAGPGAAGIGTAYMVQVGDGPVRTVDSARPDSSTLSLLVDGRSWEAGLVATEDGFEVDILGIRHEAAVIDPQRKVLRMAAGAGADVVKTAMPGRVVRILVAEGDEVSEGEPVIVVEAMKMENELAAPRDGVVARICVESGAQVEAKTVLVEFE